MGVCSSWGRSHCPAQHLAPFTSLPCLHPLCPGQRRAEPHSRTRGVDMTPQPDPTAQCWANPPSPGALTPHVPPAWALQHSPWDSPPSPSTHPQLETALPRAPPAPAPPPHAPHSLFSRGFGVFSTYCTGPRALSPLCPPSSCCSTSCQAVDGGLWMNPRAGSTLQPPPPPPS